MVLLAHSVVRNLSGVLVNICIVFFGKFDVYIYIFIRLCSFTSQFFHLTLYSFMYGSGRFLWRSAWQPTPVFLPGESQGQRSLVGYSPQSCTESDMTELIQHAYTRKVELLDHMVVPFLILGELHAVFQIGCTNLHSHLQCMGVPVSSHPCQDMSFFIIAILTGVRHFLLQF